jgi:hypothetical protein
MPFDDSLDFIGMDMARKYEKGSKRVLERHEDAAKAESGKYSTRNGKRRGTIRNISN